MAAWRRKALGLFPRHAQAIEDPTSTVYQLFFDLLPESRDALAASCEAEVDRIFGFAAWCFSQPELSNAAAVAFYEHVFDGRWIDRREIARRIPPRIASAVMPLWEERLPPDRLAWVRFQFGTNESTDGRKTRRPC